MVGYTNRLCVVGIDTAKGSDVQYMDLTIGVFFDGTLNSKYNTKWKSVAGNGKDNSYNNDYTNVVKLWRGYNSNNSTSYKVYIEGVGTESPLSLNRNASSSKKYAKEKDTIDRDDNEPLVSSQNTDSLFGAGLGMGVTGINAKIHRACMLINNIVSKACSNKRKKLRILTLDVFGFSRGAASARSFVSGIYSLTKQRSKEAGSYNVSLLSWLSVYSSPQKPTINVRFLGLYDTVSSYGYFIDDDVAELSLGIPSGEPNVKYIVQLSAADEYREKFPLTNIRSAGARGREIILPGAHSDIGGGYCSVETERMYSSLQKSWFGRESYFHGDLKCRGNKTYDELVAEGWLPMGWNQPIYNLDKYGRSFVTYNKFRKVKNDYARIPLYVMYELSNLKGIPYKATMINGDSTINGNYIYLNLLRNMILSKVRNNQPLYVKTINKKNQDGLVFMGNQADLELIKRNRYEFMHLSVDGTFPAGGAEDNNIRKIIDDTVMK